MKDHSKGGSMTWEWQERLFEVVRDEASVGDSGITDWLNELESDEGLEVIDVFLTRLGQRGAQPYSALVLVIVRVFIREKEP